LPIASSHAFDNRGHAYNVSKIINADTEFNLEAYEAKVREESRSSEDEKNEAENE
jgi:hypothetical protein